MINDITGQWYSSDWHFNHLSTNKAGELRGVTLFERTQFGNDIAAHDKYIIQQMRQWAERHQGHTLWCLGDFGNISYLWLIEELRYSYNIKTCFVYGNHDKVSNLPSFQEAFDEVYLNPVYIHPRIIVCHEPVWPAPVSTIVIHGHLHCMILDNPQFLNANIHICNYQPISSKKVLNALGRLEKVEYKFLQEPYCRHLKLIQFKEDAVYDHKTGKIDYEASVRLYNKNHPDHPKQPIPKHTLSW